jgi:hypothetical protein
MAKGVARAKGNHPKLKARFSGVLAILAEENFVLILTAELP